MTTEPPPKPSLARNVVLSCSVALLVLVLGVIGFLASIWIGHGREAKRVNERNFAAVTPLMSAIEAYRRAHGRYPESLCDLQLKQKPAVDARLYFSASQSGGEFWLAIFPWREASFVMPSDMANEYSSRTGRWTEIDVSEATAKDDERWVEECKPVPSSF